MTRRRASPEGLYLARRIAHRNRLEQTGVSGEVVDRWLTAWGADARQRGLDPRTGEFWTDAEDLDRPAAAGPVAIDPASRDVAAMHPGYGCVDSHGGIDRGTLATEAAPGLSLGQGREPVGCERRRIYVTWSL